MAEFVELRAEEWVEELELMERIQLFKPKEVKSIAKKRRDFEYKIQRRTKDKEDYLRYIQFETDLHKLIKARGEELKIKKADIEYAHANRIGRLWKQVIFLFQDDTNLWLSYFNFCKNVRFTASVSQMLGKMIQVHADKPELWVYAAKWEFEECFSVENARQYLLRGIRNHPDNKTLYTEFFKLELQFSKMKNEEVQDRLKKKPNWVPDDTLDQIVKCKLAEAIYESSVKKIQDVDYKVDLLNLTKDYPSAGNIQSKIFQDLIKNHSDDELTWDTIAKRELDGIVTNLDGEEAMEIDVEKEREGKTLKGRIQRSVDVFEKAVKKLNTQKMWSFYLDHLIELDNDSSSLPIFKKKLLRNALEGALEAGLLAEKYFLHWIEILKSAEGKQKTLSKILKAATESHPESLKLWYMRLKFHLARDQEKIGAGVFKEALEKLPEELSLWKIMIQYYQIKSTAKVDQIFKGGLARGGAISQALKPLYIEWLVTTKGIGEARTIFEEELLYPPCLELFTKMASLESMQADTNMKAIRRCHDLACKHFGKNNIDVWLNYIRFELKFGEPIKVSQIYRKAKDDLEPRLADEFQAEYNFFKT